MNHTYLNWLIQKTATRWWHDSAEAGELDLGLKRGAVGVTTNPFLANIAIHKNRSLWGSTVEDVIARNPPPEAKAEALTVERMLAKPGSG